MEANKRKQILECVEKIGAEILHERGGVKEIYNKLQGVLREKEILSHMETISFEEWCNKWWGKGSYPNGSWENAFRIYMFKIYLGKDDVYFEVNVSFEDGKKAEVLANKLRALSKIDVRMNNDEDGSNLVGIFDILEEEKVRCIIEEFCRNNSGVVKHVQYCHN